jgi:hypothetical protein
MQEPKGFTGGAANALAKFLVIVAGVVILLICTVIVLEISGRVSDWVLGERLFGGLDLLLWAIIVAGAVVFVAILVIFLFARATNHALVLLAMLLLAPFLVVPASRLIAPSSPSTGGFAAWAKSVNTTPVNTWLASNPAVVPSSAMPFATYYVQDTSALSRASSISVTSVPRYDTGRLPDEVLLLPAKDAIFAVYHTGWRASRIVIIGPAATSIPAHFHPSCTWTTIRPDLVVGDFSRS